jgi:predicted regulator of Ras-like GTPase activity (Roadblock/LC7/MglB family)
MIDKPLVIYEEDHRLVLAVLERLVRDASARCVFLIDRNGQIISKAGEHQELDTTSLGSLAAGNVAATGGLAQVIGEDEFPTHFFQGRKDHLYVSIVSRRIVLLVVFGERSSLGLVRLRVKKTTSELAQLFEKIEKKADQARPGGAASPFAEITDDDIDNLFES